ncbi:hypothetical protein ACFSQP_00135 [Bizionia sediminis]|uniref:Lipocalin-like domain-containing protein n=1 Tax=Bizionia sediminis TaxID=1737064 RepID=A0ABW5KPE8_9FLAO
MKKPNQLLFLLLGILFFTLTACQDEAVEVTPPNNQEIIQSDSNLASLLRNTSSNNGRVDNIMDNSDCFTVDLPVTIVANGITLTIETLSDLSLIEAIFNENSNDLDDLEFLFPITIILNDFTEINIETEEELESFVEGCIADDDIIECANFVYPISFSIYNTSFQVIETVVVNNDYELYVFLDELEDNESGVLLASLNFPVSIAYTNGTTLEVANNQELEAAINAAAQNCEETDYDADCDIDVVMNNLKNCYWNISSYNGDNHLEFYTLNFKGGDSLQVTTPNFEVIEANWQLTANGEGASEITISNFITDTNGTWILDDCDADQLELVQTIPNTTDEIVMILNQDCEETPFDCFSDLAFTVCDENNDGIELKDLEILVLEPLSCNQNYTATFFETEADAQNNTNPIAQPSNYALSMPNQTIYLRVAALNGVFEIYEIDFTLENCAPYCNESDVAAWLQTCTWEVISYNGDDHLALFDFNFVSASQVVITGDGLTINANWAVTQTGNTVQLAFSNVNGPNIQAVNGDWIITGCQSGFLQMENTNNTVMIMEQDCNNAGMCTPEDVVGMLLNCEWTATSYAGSDFSMFNFNFMANNEATIFIPNGNETYTANWSVNQGSTGVEVTLSNISGGNVVIMEGTYVVVECTDNQIVLHDVTNSNNELVLDKDCD